jgi:non-homologous end joining protein Ku
MAHPIWSGFLKLSLVSVPVKAYTATDSSGEVHLNQLRRDCNSLPAAAGTLVAVRRLC